MSRLFFVLVASCGVIICEAAGGEISPAVRTTVFTAGQDGYHTYRIPSLILTTKNTLLAICEGRKTGRGDAGDIDLVLKHSEDGGQSWSELQLLYEEGGTAKTTIGNPCPVVDASTGTIWLPFNRDNDTVLVTHSTDDGRTWSKPRDITADVKTSGWGWYACGPGVGIQLTQGQFAGRLVIPCDHREMHDGRDAKFSHVFFSDDHGASWKLGGSVSPHTDECQVVELRDGRLLINMRNYWGSEGGRPEQGSRRTEAHSDDGGSTWSELAFSDTLIEPICQASLIRVPATDASQPDLLAFSNPASTTKRERLTVRVSSNEGKTWPHAAVLHASPAAYSCLASLARGELGCLFESGEKNANERIEFARFNIDDVK